MASKTPATHPGAFSLFPGQPRLCWLHAGGPAECPPSCSADCLALALGSEVRLQS